MTTDRTVALVRQAIFHVLDDGNHRTLGLEWDFTKDEERVDFADAVVAWIPQVQARLDAAGDVSHTSGTPRTDEIAYRRIADEEDENEQYDALLGLARQLERENAELSDQVMRWFKAASPYATPGSLEEGLKKLRAEAIKEVINAIEDAPLTYAGPDPHIVSDLRYLIIRSVRDLIEDHDGPIDSTVKPSAWD